MPPLLFFFGTTEAEQALLSFLFELFRPLGGPAYHYSRKDHYVGFKNTNTSELRFRALLTDGEREVRFGRTAVG